METVACQLTMSNMDRLLDHVRDNAKHAKRMIGPDTHVGQSVVICGAGPSLAAHVGKLPKTRHVWACNSALPYMRDQGAKVTHGFAIDAGDDMLRDWARTFDVSYLVASSVAPALVAHLLKARRRLTFFHSYLGVADPAGWDGDEPCEMHLYRNLYKASVRVGYGLNAVPRAICLALVMGFSEILVYGADCACKPDSPPMPEYGTAAYAEWMHGLVMYADGRAAGPMFGHNAVMAEAEIGGRRWATRVDMIISANHLLDLVRDYPGRVALMGDTMPAAFALEGPGFREGLPTLIGKGRIEGFAAA